MISTINEVPANHLVSALFDHAQLCGQIQDFKNTPLTAEYEPMMREIMNEPPGSSCQLHCKQEKKAQ
jgi:hypothetical protein